MSVVQKHLCTILESRDISKVFGSKKLMGAPKNLRVDPFPDPIGHFGAPAIWIFEVLIEGMIESKKLI